MLIDTILNFLQQIGISVTEDSITEATFLPGILIRNGGLLVDRTQLLYPGDILHEAGHLAVMPARIRTTMNGDIGSDSLQQGGEMMAIAWSYAVCIHLKIDPHIVFHENGYKGGGASIVQNFSEGRYFGVPLLAWQEMTCERDKTGQQALYPAIKNWLCQVDKYESVLS